MIFIKYVWLEEYTLGQNKRFVLQGTFISYIK